MQEVLSKTDVDRIALRVLRAYCALPCFHGERITAIDPEILATELLGLDVQYHVLSVSGNVLGLTAKNSYRIRVFDHGPSGEFCVLKKNGIFIDRYLRDDPSMYGRCHFTLAHELSHHILWMLFPSAVSPTTPNPIHYSLAESSVDDPEERNTNALASAILMPQQLIKRKMREHGFGAKIRYVNRVCDPWGYRQFSEIAATLGVSKQALCIRMKSLGLLEREYLRDPYAMILSIPDDNEYDIYS